MKLFTKDIDKKLFAQFMKGSDLSSQMVVAKIFNPYGRGTWYIINSDPNDPDYLWAIVKIIDVEVGSVSRSELETLRVPPFRLNLERDMSFTPMNAKELYDGLVSGKHYAKGGYMEKGGIVVTSIKDIPDFQEMLDAGKITYRGLGMGKLADDFYKLAGTGGTRIKVGGKEYFITDTEFQSFSRGEDGKMRIKFDAPFRKFEDGGEVKSDVDKLLDKRSELEDKLFAAKVKENERWNNLGWGSGMRLSKINVSTKRSDSLKEKMKQIDSQLKSLGYDKFPVGRYEKGGEIVKPLSYYKYETPKITISWKGKAQPYGRFKTAEEAFKKIKEVAQTEKERAEFSIVTPDVVLKYSEVEKFSKGGQTKKFQVYHETLASALAEVETWAKENGYTFTSNSYFPDVTVGGVKYGETKRFTREVKKDGAKKEGHLAIQIYRMDSGRYELNLYPSYAKGGEVSFADKVSAVKSSLLKRKKVAPAVQKDYGKTYSPKEAEDSAKRIVGAMTAKWKLENRMKKRK